MVLAGYSIKYWSKLIKQFSFISFLRNSESSKQNLSTSKLGKYLTVEQCLQTEVVCSL